MKGLALIALVFSVFVAPTQAASRATYICDGYPSGMWPNLRPQLIDSNVLVPAGATCRLYVSEVTGNVVVEGVLAGFGNTFDRNVIVTGGEVFFPIPIGSHGLGRSHVQGNLHITTDGRVAVSARVDGNVSLEGAIYADFTYAAIGGNVSVKNSANVLFFDVGTRDDPGIGGNLSLVGNADVGISWTSIGGKLGCEGNDPAPAVGDHVNARDATGQCSLTPAT